MQRKRVAVLGAVSQIKDKVWRGHRIGFGVANLIFQALFNAGRFIVIEEKAEVRKQTDEFTRRNWTAPENARTGEQAISLAKKLGVDLPRSVE